MPVKEGPDISPVRGLVESTALVVTPILLVILVVAFASHFAKGDAFGNLQQRVSVSVATLAAAGAAIKATLEYRRVHRSLQDNFVLDQHRSLMDFQSRIVSNPDLARLVYKATGDPTALSDDEVATLFWLVVNKCSHLETIVLLGRDRMSEDDIDSWLAALRTAFPDRVLRSYWAADGDTYANRFQVRVNEKLGRRAEMPMPRGAAVREFADLLRSDREL